jgi:glycerol uptake facilitator-like aquaporin
LFRDEGIDVLLSTHVLAINGLSGEHVSLQLQSGNETRTVEGTDVLVALGRTPNTTGIGLDRAGIEVAEKGHIRVNDHLETTAPNVWAMGDCAGSPYFTHISEDDASIILENLNGGRRSTAGRMVPYCVFIDPELARVGLNESQARERGVAYRIASVPFDSAWRAWTISERRGFMKTLIDAHSDRILGFTAFGPEAGELMGTVQLAMLAGVPYTILRDAVFAHPTMTEGLRALFMAVPQRLEKMRSWSNTRERPRIEPEADGAYKSTLNAADGLRLHWPEYLMEAGESGFYLLSACAFATLFWHPTSPIQRHLPSDAVRRMLMGLAMGATIIAIVLSPWGKQSGAHFNPAVTFTFYRLRKVALWDAVFYCAAQLLGAVAGVALASLVLQGAPADKAVRYAATIPGIYGDSIAFVAELAISFLLMSAILFASNHKVLAPYTHYFATILVAVYIAFESPLSGMSTNPARTSAPRCMPVTGTPFGSISSGHLWACWRRPMFSFWPVSAKLRIVRNCITITTSVASFAMTDPTPWRRPPDDRKV